MKVDVKKDALMLLETVPDLTEKERAYLGEVAEGAHSCLISRCTVHNDPAAGVRIGEST